MQGTYERFEVPGAEYYATYDINSPTKDLSENNLHRVAMNSLEADGMPGHWMISFPDFPDKYIAHSEFYESSIATEPTRCLSDATEFRYVIYVQDDQLPPNEVATEYISTIQVTSADCEPECGCDYASNEYLIQPGNTSPAVNNLSAEWQRDFGGKLCYGDIEHGAPTTYVAYIENDAEAIGTITITGEAYLPVQLTYYDALGHCYTATPTIENGTDVYRFQSVVSPTSTPTPTLVCTRGVGPASFAQFPSSAPVAHEAGGTYYWCAGTQYTDPGLRSEALIDSCGVDVSGNVVTTYWTHPGKAQWGYGEKISNPTEVAKLGLDAEITADDGTTKIGPAPYAFGVFYEVTSSTGHVSTSGRAIWVYGPGQFPDNKLCSSGCEDTGCDPCNPVPCPDCCSPTANEYQVDTSQQPQFVATGITLMSFAYNGNLCVGNSTGGLPKSISLYVPGYSDAVGVISVLGELDSAEISLEVTDDVYLSSGVPSMQGKCLKGSINNDRCDLTEN